MKNITKFIATVSELFYIKEVHYSSDNNYKCIIHLWDTEIEIKALSELLKLYDIVENLSTYYDKGYYTISANIVQ